MPPTFLLKNFSLIKMDSVVDKDGRTRSRKKEPEFYFNKNNEGEEVEQTVCVNK